MSLGDQVYQAAPPSVVNDTIKPSREGTPEYSNRILFFKWKNESEFDELLLGKKDAVNVFLDSAKLGLVHFRKEASEVDVFEGKDHRRPLAE